MALDQLYPLAGKDWLQRSSLPPGPAPPPSAAVSLLSVAAGAALRIKASPPGVADRPQRLGLGNHPYLPLSSRPL